MNNIGEIIKELAIEAVEQQKPVAAVIGRIKEEHRLIVETEQKMIIDEEFMIVPERYKNTDWREGERVALLRCDGGQMFILLDKV